MAFMDEHSASRTPGILLARGWTRPPSKGFIRINKIKEKIIYVCSLSVNYNNRSPATGNDSQNGINCHRQAAIIYELTNNILKNNSVARLPDEKWLNCRPSIRLCVRNSYISAFFYIVCNMVWYVKLPIITPPEQYIVCNMVWYVKYCQYWRHWVW